jgi:hypothetical protein
VTADDVLTRISTTAHTALAVGTNPADALAVIVSVLDQFDADRYQRDTDPADDDRAAKFDGWSLTGRTAAPLGGFLTGGTR